MARRGALTALQAVLAGVSGGAQGYVQQQELERKRQQEKTAAEERQALNLASLYERGFKTPEELARGREQQGMAGARLFSAMKGSSRLTDQDVNALSQAAATQGGPAGRVRYGGQDLVLPETDAGRSERLGLLGAERERLAKQQEADADRAAATEKQRGISELLNQPRFRGMPQEYRAAVASGMMTLPQAIEAARPRPSTGPAPERKKTMADVNSEVGAWVRANIGGTRRDEYGTETRMTRDQVMEEADQLRQSLMEIYGLTPTSPRKSTPGITRLGGPLTFSFSSGRTYELPEE